MTDFIQIVVLFSSSLCAIHNTCQLESTGATRTIGSLYLELSVRLPFDGRLTCLYMTKMISFFSNVLQQTKLTWKMDYCHRKS